MGDKVVMALLVERTVVQCLGVRRMLVKIPLLEKEDLLVVLLGVPLDQRGFLLLLQYFLKKIFQR